MLDGVDDRCDDPGAASAAGVAFLNPDGTIGLGVTSVFPGGTPMHLEATMDIRSLSGTWRDSAGNSGAIVFTPSGTSAGGTALPVAPWVSVLPGSITAIHLANGAVGAAAIAPNAITGANVVNGSLTRDDLAPGTIGTPELTPNSVSGTHIIDGTITAADLATASVGAAELAPNAVVSSIANGTITGLHLAANSVTSDKVVDGSLTGADILNGSITAADLAAISITGAVVSDNSLTGADILNGSLTGVDLAGNSVTSAHVVDASLTSADILDAPKATAPVENNGAVPLPSGFDTVVSTVTVVAPAAGRVILNASGSFGFENAVTIDSVVCSFSTGLTIPVAAPNTARAAERNGADFFYVPFGGTRTFNVAPGSSTFRLVCNAQGTAVSVWNPVLTAQFIAGS